MKKTRRKFSASFKAKVVIEALKERESLQALSKRYEVHPNQISKWKREFIEKSEKIYAGEHKEEEQIKKIDALYRKIGELEMENDFLKKKLIEKRTVKERVQLVSGKYKRLSIRKQCKLLGVNRSSLYYKPLG